MTIEAYTERAFRAYVECALFTDSIGEEFAAYWANKTGEEAPAPDVSFQSFGFGPDDFATSALDSMRADVTDFVSGIDSAVLDSIDAEQFGHDFWLTRNRHGAGFWDRGLGEIGDQLTAMAHPYGESYVYIGDDELLYVA